jgi:hypothetical protein
MQFDKIVIKVTGVSGLLQNNPLGGMVAQGAGPRVKHIPTAEEEAARLCYKNVRGELYIPVVAFRNSMIAAASGLKLGRLSAKKVVQSSVIPRGEQAVLIHPETNRPIKDYEIFTTSVVIRNAAAKPRVLRSRPLIPQWSVALEFDLNREFLPGYNSTMGIVDLMNRAGQLVGVGDWRPGTSGTYGRFTAELLHAGNDTTSAPAAETKKRGRKAKAAPVEVDADDAEGGDSDE